MREKETQSVKREETERHFHTSVRDGKRELVRQTYMKKKNQTYIKQKAKEIIITIIKLKE